MSTTIKLSDELIKDARRYGEVYSRSVPRQIEYWSRIGKIAEENPDLSFDFIKDILMAKQEAQEGEKTPYKFS
jgi:hypothetical protein